MFNNNKRFFLAGNIGCGKTTAMVLLRHLLEEHEVSGMAVEMYPENVEAWEPYLHAFYAKNIPEAKMALQMEIDRHHRGIPLNVYRRIRDGTLDSDACIVTERSPIEARDVFTREHSLGAVNTPMSRLDDSIQAVQTTTVNQAHGFWSMGDEQPTEYVYIRLPPEHCMRNIAVRGRSSERTVSYDYLHAIHARYEALMDNLPAHKVHVVADYEEAANYIMARITAK